MEDKSMCATGVAVPHTYVLVCGDRLRVAYNTILSIDIHCVLGD